MLVRLEDEGVDALKQFLKNFGHKRDRDKTAIIFPDGEVIHVDDHGESVLQINAWWGKTDDGRAIPHLKENLFV